MISALDKRLSSISLLTAVTVCFAVSPWTSYDPINLIKCLFFTTLTFALLGILLAYRRLVLSRFSRTEWTIFLFFPSLLIVPLFLADANRSQQFWGVFGRNTGFLTYFSLWLLLLGTSLIRDPNFGKRAIEILLISSIPMSAYALIQFFKIDPINWSSKNIFGTLGNINFLSAYFGLTSIVGIIFAIVSKLPNKFRVPLLLVVLLDLFLVYQTDSIQGIVVFTVGITIFAGFYISKNPKFSRWKWPYLVLVLISAVLGVAGILNHGPLKAILYQVTNIYRADYMLAALKMTAKFPFTGVGLDSYDNWYRVERGFISTYRTGWNRTSNSAHNIWLDISSGGGILLLLSYLVILVFAARAAFFLLKKSNLEDIWAISAVAAWAAYQVQSIISINQIGIGVWGWLLSGVVISMWKSEVKAEGNVDSKSLKSKKGRSAKGELKPSAAIASIVLGGIGFALAYAPFSADSSFRSAADKRDLKAMIAATEKPGATSIHIAKALEAAFQNKYFDLATQLSDRLTKDFPSETFGWQIRTGLSTITQAQRDEAKSQIKKWDPWFACLEPDPVATIRSWYSALPADKRWELNWWWGFVTSSTLDEAQLRQVEVSQGFQERLDSQCKRQ